ncbi:enoyl-CoA hydratase [Acidisphaera sp. L21]|uniref:enoyl-CoA hydratase n=1 Tax=Acidisphaera sp. L21 TaxID=1641851 RepID=UPI00131C41DD|nr:enoyl-CoA hydratase [Acidisphaera sp. L21]
MTPEIRVDLAERRPGRIVATITIDNAAKLNTLTSPLMDLFAEAMEDLAQREELAAVVLTGAGERAFIGGANIDEMAELDADTAREFITRVHRCCSMLRHCPAPVIARIQGYTLGAGLEMAAACDVRVAAQGAVFGMPEVKIGIPSVVEAALLPTLIGWGRTREMLLFGENITAETAAAWGLVERLVPAADLDAAVGSYLDSLMAAGPEAVRNQKTLIRAWEELPMSRAIAAGVDAFAASWDTDEPRATMATFLAARRKKSA